MCWEYWMAKFGGGGVHMAMFIFSWPDNHLRPQSGHLFLPRTNPIIYFHPKIYFLDSRAQPTPSSPVLKCPHKHATQLKPKFTPIHSTHHPKIQIFNRSAPGQTQIGLILFHSIQSLYWGAIHGHTAAGSIMFCIIQSKRQYFLSVFQSQQDEHNSSNDPLSCFHPELVNWSKTSKTRSHQWRTVPTTYLWS